MNLSLGLPELLSLLRISTIAAVWLLASVAARPAQPPLPGSTALTMEGDLSAEMVAGIARFLDREIAASGGGRDAFWRPEFSSRDVYEKSVAANRDRFGRIIGVIDQRLPDPEMEYVATVSVPARVAETDRFVAHAVRWPVLEGVFGEGLLLQPKGRVVANVIAVPDADQAPEAIAGILEGLPADRQYARRLAENGCRVVVPVLADRTDAFSGSERLKRWTNQPHREWIYRQAYQFGRHVIGYEVQKIRSAADWLASQDREAGLPIGVVGWGEGGLLALYSAAVDTRIRAALVSGYFGPREKMWREPIYRNVFGLLREFGDAGIVRLIIPRKLIVEYSKVPDVRGPPMARPGRAGAAPGLLDTPAFGDVLAEVERARRFAGPFRDAVRFLHGDGDSATGPVAEASLLEFLRRLSADVTALAPVGKAPVELRRGFDMGRRQERTVRDMQHHARHLLDLSPIAREQFLWARTPAKSPEAWRDAMGAYRKTYWEEIIGRFPTGQLPLNPRSRMIYDEKNWTGYEVVLDVLPDVYAWGLFLIPKNLAPDEKRPVVVAQHGLEGLPGDLIGESKAYHGFAAKLVERGFVVFAPHNPYRGGDNFRVLQRKANPLGKSLFGIIVAQHERILDWLAQQPMVDSRRIGFYGLSYGGNSAMVVPAILERYAASINSGCFNDWAWKIASTEWGSTYVFSKEYEKPDFNLGQTFGDAELAALIAPRPFMVERGHDDPVGLDERIAFEYAKVRRLYVRLNIPERTEIEYFNGVHEIRGVGTFKFLHRHLGWPEPVRGKGE